MRRKTVPIKTEDDEKKVLTPMEEIEQCEYISDISDKIDSLVEQAKKSPKDQRKVLLRKAQDLIDAHELYVGRKMYKPVL
jgi:ElaB/YqjD/DUF883 family membrane-anchored ribosome-binding protein